MGLDLLLLPCEAWHVTDSGHGDGPELFGFSRTVLNLGRVGIESYGAFARDVLPHTTALPDGHNVSSWVGARVPDGAGAGDTMYGKLEPTDVYGDPYRYVEAQHLLKWLESWFHRVPWQRAVTAHVRALLPETKVVLAWR